MERELVELLYNDYLKDFTNYKSLEIIPEDIFNFY